MLQLVYSIVNFLGNRFGGWDFQKTTLFICSFYSIKTTSAFYLNEDSWKFPIQGLHCIVIESLQTGTPCRKRSRQVASNFIKNPTGGLY